MGSLLEMPGGELARTPEPDMRRLSWAVKHTGLDRKTLHRRLDTWTAGDRSPYALMGSRSTNPRGDRLVDPLDAERVRLQEAGRLDREVNAEMWRRMVNKRLVPWLYVTREKWFQDIVGPPPAT